MKIYNSRHKFAMNSIFSTAIIFVSTAHAVFGEAQTPPHFLSSIDREIIFDEQHPFVMPCEAAGDPAPKYFWTKNGNIFHWTTQDDRISQVPGKGSLKINHPDASDVGLYQCFAENIWGTAASSTVFVGKFELGSFKAEAPILIKVIEGQPFNITCQAPTGWPKPTVSWLKERSSGRLEGINNSRITGDPTGTLWFSNITLNDTLKDMNYICTAGAYFLLSGEVELKPATGNRFNLEVVPSNLPPEKNLMAPIIRYTSSKFQTAIAGEFIYLYCIFGGIPLPTITWYKNSVPIQSKGNISLHEHHQILIQQISPNDEGNYTCQASNGIGDPISHTIDLKVLARPTFTTKPKSVTTGENERVEFYCEAAGNPTPKIIWTHNGKLISEEPSNPRRKVTTNSIIIEKALRNDTGNYGCNATNSLGYVYEDVYVNVLAEPPLITESSNPNEEAVEASTMVLRCHATGWPKPRISWLKDGAKVTGNRFRVADNGDLTITKVSFADMGSYTCSAQNNIATANTIISLVVRRRTLIPSGIVPSNISVKTGESVTFRCSVEGDPSLNIDVNWLRNGTLIDFATDLRFIKASDNSLRITATNKMDDGKYTCVASTRLDEAKAEVKLAVQDALKNST